MKQYTITIRDTGNFIRYDLTDDHGCVCASISAEAWDSGIRGFRPTELRCLQALQCLVPGRLRAEVVRDAGPKVSAQERFLGVNADAGCCYCETMPCTCMTEGSP